MIADLSNVAAKYTTASDSTNTASQTSEPSSEQDLTLFSALLTVNGESYKRVGTV